AAGVPVLVEPLDNIPSYDALGIRYENAALLARAGVKVALMETDTHNARNLRQQAGNAVSYGMSWDQALRAVTLAPAEMLGVADRYGSLESGKVANVVVWSGDPFEFTTGVEHVFIRGKEMPLTSRQTELFERYKKLPPTYEAAGGPAFGWTLTLKRFLFLCSNFTTPSTTVNSVSSDARRTFSPGWKFVSRCLTRMLPAVTNSPAKRFTPKYLGPESRPLREEPTPFLWAIRSLSP